MSAIWVEILTVRGSAPRDAGTAMKVTADGLEGTIGGGALEHRAIAIARDRLRTGGGDLTRRFALGPSLGQCCGGSVSLLFTRELRETDRIPSVVHGPTCGGPHPRHLWLWGAGHVGRACVASAPPDRFRVTWVDESADRFPARMPDNARAVPAADMPRLAARATRAADHLIFTYSHDIDFALCAALLQRGVDSIGLIGSATKWARFSKRLRGLGLDPTPITCPIGDKSLGKAPMQIATSTIDALLLRPSPAAVG